MSTGVQVTSAEEEKGEEKGEEERGGEKGRRKGEEERCTACEYTHG